MKITRLILICIFLSAIYTEAQFLNSEKIVNQNIKALLFNETNTYYFINSIDIEIRKTGRAYFIQDSNNLLADCFVFSAKDSINRDQILFGIYKDGNIIWKSRPFISGKSYQFAGDLWQIRNLKRNSIVYLIFNLPFIPMGEEASLWIISWDGFIGEVVNEIDDNDYSKIIAEHYSFDILDVDGDGNFEITGTQVISSIYNEETDEFEIESKEVVFSWNGEEIGDNGINLPSVLPKNKIDAIISSTIEKSSGNYIYSYKVDNLENSIQSIENFSIQLEIDTVISSTTPSKWKFYNITNKKLLHFSSDPFYTFQNLISPGDSTYDFQFVSNFLPGITNYLLQGNNGKRSRIDEIIGNSKSGFTIGPVTFWDTLGTSDFLDSLLSSNTLLFNIGWITNQATSFKYDSLFNLSKTQLQQNNNNAARTTLQTVLQEVDVDSTSNLTSEAYALLRYNTEYLLEKIPLSSANLLVKLTNSLGNQIPASNVMYYEGSWKDAVNNGDGTFTVITTKPTVSIRMFYEYANQTVHNVPAQNNTYTFTTVNAAVELRNSSGSLIDAGTVQYYAGAWRSFGTTVNGVANKELLPINYSFRMTYEYVPLDKQQDISTNSTVTFSTVLCTVKVTKANGQPLSGASTKYYSGAWRDIGLTNTNGEAAKELLPKSLNFRAASGSVSQDKQQDIGVNNLVEIQLP